MVKYIFDLEKYLEWHKKVFEENPKDGFWCYDGCDGKEVSAKDYEIGDTGYYAHGDARDLWCRVVEDGGFDGEKTIRGWIEDVDEHEIVATVFKCPDCGTEFSSSELTDKDFKATYRFCPYCGNKRVRD